MSRKKQTPLAGGAGEHGQAHHDHFTPPFPKGVYTLAARMLDDGMRIYKAEILDFGRIPGTRTFAAYIDGKAEWPHGERISFVMLPSGVVADVRDIASLSEEKGPPGWPSLASWTEAARQALAAEGAR